MNKRMLFNPTEATAAGETDARSLLAALSTAKNYEPADLLANALAEIIGLAADDQMDECADRLVSFCNVLGPVLHQAMKTQGASHIKVTS